MHNDSNNPAEDATTGLSAAWCALTGDPEDAQRQTLHECPGPYSQRAGASAVDSGTQSADEGNGDAAGQPTASSVHNTVGSVGIMPDDFPMIVWLRGDEPWFNDFSVDADTAMAELGIRRSRLTQISGRELRVGKKRVDRYVRPYFRPIDLAAYKNFTRATASHLKSSAVLDDVLGRLEQETSQILERITAAVRENSTSYETTLEQIASELRQTQGRLLREVGDRLDMMEREMYGSVQAALTRSTGALTQLTIDTGTLRDSLNLQNEKMIGLLNQNHLLLRELNAAQAARIETLGHQIASQMSQSVADQMASAGQHLTNQIEQTVHQTRLAIRSDLKKIKESIDEKSNTESQNSSPARWRRPVGSRSGYHSRRLRY